MRVYALWLAMSAAALAGCPDDDDRADTDSGADTAPDTEADTTDGTDDVEVFTPPTWFPAPERAADERLSFARLAGPVRVVVDDRGVSHIYGDDPHDLTFVQGYVTARDRIFQMHTLRSAASGVLAELTGPGSLSGDLFLRLLKLRRVGDEMATWTQENDPETYAFLTAYADGVNAFIARMKDGLETAPIEVQLFGADAIVPWTPGDTMTIVRLQTWDLGFDMGDFDRMEKILAIQERHAGTALEGVERDVFLPEPIRKAATVEPDGGASLAGSYDLGESLQDSFFQGLRADQLRRIIAPLRELDHIPHHAFRGEDYGSNNWLVHGSLTATDKPLVANDTHLALRNPAVFYHIHMDNTAAGGDLNINGVQFAGAPGIVLGNNARAAWGATVFFSDVTDVYREKLSPDGDAVWYEGEWVDVVAREETFRFGRPAAAETCAAAAPAWIANLAHTETFDSGVCTLTVTFQDVPHHGPIIPWSYDVDANGDKVAFSVMWTGFEPTREFSAIRRLWTVGSVEELKTALDFFDVGAQNWVAGFVDGDIAWYPSHQVPIRRHIAGGDTTWPPFLPMPGDTAATQWDGFIPRDELPQAINPPAGYLATANQDPIGTSFDNDPFNEAHYLGYQWTPGFRQDRIQQRLATLAAAGEMTIEDMKSVQGDHHSNFGEEMVPALLTAIDAARAGTDARAAALLTPAIEAAYTYLDDWSSLDWWAASGVGAAAGSDEARAAVATAIFHTYVVFLGAHALGDEGLRLGTPLERVLWRMTEKPETMTVSYDETREESVLWDDVTTAEGVESRHEIMIRALAAALAFLADPETVGPGESGGFGTADMSQWRWGQLHTVTLPHNVSVGSNIPPPGEHPHGFPRPCDQFCVDAAHPGLTDTRFTFSSGAAIRNVYSLESPVVQHGVIPGGQSEQPDSPHYRDDMDLWVQNLAPPVRFATEDVVDAAARVIDFIP